MVIPKDLSPVKCAECGQFDYTDYMVLTPQKSGGVDWQHEPSCADVREEKQSESRRIHVSKNYVGSRSR